MYVRHQQVSGRRYASVGIGLWTQTFDSPCGIEAIHCKESSVGRRKRKGAAGNESRHAQARSRGKVGKLVVGQRTTGSKQQVAQSRHNNNNNNNNNNSFSFYLNRFDLFSLPRLLTRWFVCVCVCTCLASGCVLTRTRRERAEYMGQPTASGHRNATLTHHTHSRHDRAHHRLSRYRGVGWKRKGVGEGVWVCLYSVSVRLMTTCRGCSRRERDEDEIRSCLRSSLIEKLG